MGYLNAINLQLKLEMDERRKKLLALASKRREEEEVEEEEPPKAKKSPSSPKSHKLKTEPPKPQKRSASPVQSSGSESDGDSDDSNASPPPPKSKPSSSKSKPVSKPASKKSKQDSSEEEEVDEVSNESGGMTLLLLYITYRAQMNWKDWIPPTLFREADGHEESRYHSQTLAMMTMRMMKMTTLTNKLSYVQLHYCSFRCIHHLPSSHIIADIRLSRL